MKIPESGKPRCQFSSFGLPVESDQGKRHRVKARSLLDCGSYLWFRRYFSEEKARLISANFCRHYRMCPFCAHRRSMKLVAAYLPKFEQVLTENPGARLFMLTLTARNGDDLLERACLVMDAFRAMTEKARKVRSGGRHVSSLRDVLGGVRSVEIKRGKNSGEWHPHIHALLVVDGEIEKEEIVREWARNIGQTFEESIAAQDLHEVYVRADRDGVTQSNITAFCETFKYSVKFSSMDAADVVHAAETLEGLRLLQSFGCLLGVKVDDVADEMLESNDFIDYLFRWSWKSLGYSLSESGKREKTVFDGPPLSARQRLQATFPTKWNLPEKVLDSPGVFC